MRPPTLRQSVLLAGLELAMALSGRAAGGAVGSDQAAAMIVYPYVTLDNAHGTDTFLQISNTSTDPVVVHCFWDAAGTADPFLVCRNTSVVDFQFELTPRQPIGWRASQGLATFPLDGINTIGPGGAINENSLIPPVPTDPYVGSLRCVAVDANLVPVERNVLIGTATVGQRSADGSSVDGAQYNAIGFLAHSGAGNGDQTLVLGGDGGEYDGCPNVNVLPHFFDSAVEPAAQTSTISTTLVLVPCSRDLAHLVPSASVVMYDVYNEFEQHLSTQKALQCQQVSTLSTIDTANPDRSIFNVQVVGTLTGQTRIQAASGGGVLALAIETHVDTNDPSHTARAAFNTHMQGERAQADTVLVFAGTAALTPSPTLSSTPTATLQATTPTATATPSSTRTATSTSTATIQPTSTATPTNTATIRPTSTPSATSPPPSPTLNAGNDNSGCSIAAGPQPNAAACVALLLGPALLLAWSRRA